MIGGALGGMFLTFGLNWVPRRGSDDYMEAITIGNGVTRIGDDAFQHCASLTNVTISESVSNAPVEV